MGRGERSSFPICRCRPRTEVERQARGTRSSSPGNVRVLGPGRLQWTSRQVYLVVKQKFPEQKRSKRNLGLGEILRYHEFESTVDEWVSRRTSRSPIRT